MPAVLRYPVRSGDTGTAAPASVTAQLGAGEQTSAGDTILLIANSNAAISTPPAGFILDPDCSRVLNSGLYVWRRTADAGESSWVITPNSPAATCWAVAVLTNVEHAARDQAATNATAGNVVSLTVGPTGQTSQDDCFAVVAFGSSRAAGIAVAATAFSDSFAEQVDRQTVAGAGTNVGLAVGTKHLAAVGTPQCQVTWSNGAATVAVLAVYRVVQRRAGALAHARVATTVAAVKHAHATAVTGARAATVNPSPLGVVEADALAAVQAVTTALPATQIETRSR